MRRKILIGIYKIQNKINNKVYIGQSWNIRKRWSSHLSRNCENEHLKRSIAKYGKKNFDLQVIQEIEPNWNDEEIQELLDSYECWYIKEFDSTNPEKGYNKKGGGSRGKHSEEVKKIISEKRKGRKVSQEAKDRLARSIEEREFRTVTSVTTGETFDRISEASKKYGIRCNNISSCCAGELNYAGKHPVTKEKMFWVFPENLEEFMNTRYGVPLVRKKVNYSQERKDHVARMVKLARARPVFCLTTKEEFPSIIDATQKYDVSSSDISGCCRGKKKSGGVDPISGEKLIWCFLEDKLERLSNPIPYKNESYQEVYCFNTQEKFDMIKSAGAKYNTSLKGIQKCCTGKQKSAGRHPITNEPLRWCYLENLEEELKKSETSTYSSKKWKSVYCITTKKEFETVASAGKEYNIAPGGVSSCCTGNQKSAGKHPLTNEPLKWCYTKDLETKLETNLNLSN